VAAVLCGNCTMGERELPHLEGGGVPASVPTASRRRRLRNQLLQSIVPMFLLVGVGTLAAVARQEIRTSEIQLSRIETQLREALVTKGRGLVTYHADQFATLVADNAATDLQRLMIGAVRDDQDVVYGLFVDSGGKPWAYISPVYDPPHDDNRAWQSAPLKVKPLVDLALPGMGNELPAQPVQDRWLFGVHILEFSAPVMAQGELTGVLRYGVSAARLEDALHEARRESRRALLGTMLSIGVITLTTLGIAVALTFRRARRITQPLNELTVAASRLASGDRSTRVDIRSGDELQELGEAFNQMVLELNRSYQRLHHSNVELAAEIEERRRAEDERSEIQGRLIQSQKMEAFGQLAGGVAHDFNNLLTVIRANVELLQLDPGGKGLSTEIGDGIEAIDAAAERASNLTRQLLTFSRREPSNPSVLAPGDVVAGVQQMLSRLLEESIHLAVDVQQGVPSVRVDRGRLEQVIMNLAVNGRDAMVQGGTLTISVRARHLESPIAMATGVAFAGTYAELAVTDNGAGIEPQLLSRVFEPFFTTKAAGRGTGLGLATVHGIVRDAGGYIDVASTVGEGTTFCVLLPAVDDDGERLSAEPRSTALGAIGDRRLVLLCEDEESVRNVTCKLLEHGGFRVMATTSPAEAIERATVMGEPIDLLLTDVVMPGMNGFDLARVVQGIHPETAILCMSGYSAGVLSQHGEGTSDLSVLRKPFTRLELLTAAQSAIDEAALTKARRSVGGTT
jgi:signal transduction histidine kinase/ActR/RegA family two-component response regulator